MDIRVNSLVRRQHASDGTPRAGNPIGDILRVVDIVDHKPCDGAIEFNAIAKLADNTTCFVWNLHLVQI